MKINTRFTPTEACTLIAHETVSMLDMVQTEIMERQISHMMSWGGLLFC